MPTVTSQESLKVTLSIVCGVADHSLEGRLLLFRHSRHFDQLKHPPTEPIHVLTHRADRLYGLYGPYGVHSVNPAGMPRLVSIVVHDLPPASIVAHVGLPDWMVAQVLRVSV